MKKFGIEYYRTFLRLYYRFLKAPGIPGIRLLEGVVHVKPRLLHDFLIHKSSKLTSNSKIKQKV
ncbi:hypothetical protein DRO97_06375 [Archaeoglobales archaeon]|nr:MAG: hypothetical protein DRO97_06375 [Archaeoglobales archaeon]